MRRLERVENQNEVFLAALEGFEAGLWTALPGIVQSYDATKNTVVVQPSIKARVMGKDDTTPPLPGAILDKAPWWWVPLPVLVDVPVVFQGGGGYSMSFPIAANDEALVVFSSKCIDGWWQSGGVQIQNELRMHDLSDGFAFIGPRSVPRVLNPNVDLTGPQLRKDDGTVVVGISGSDIHMTTTGNVVVNAPAIKLGNGGALSKLLNDAFKTWATNHVHTSATPGNPTSAPTVAPDATMETSVVTGQ